MDSDVVMTAFASTFPSVIPGPVSGTGASPVPHELAALVLGTDRAIDDQQIDERLGMAAGLFRALRLKHPPTASHCLRVALRCSAMCVHLGVDATTKAHVEVAALLHDVGRIGIPDYILHKPGRLDPDEQAVMKQQHALALDVLRACCKESAVLEIVQHAATWFDGSSPQLANDVAGEDIPLGARILSVQNAFDSMTTDLVYRRALPLDRALEELVSCAGSQFDPYVVSQFCEMIARGGMSDSADSVRDWVADLAKQSEGMWGLGGAAIATAIDAESVFQQRLLDSMQDGVVFVDSSARVLVWNRGVAQLTGLSQESVYRKQWQPEVVDLRDPEGNPIRTRQCPLLECLRAGAEAMQRATLTNCRSREQIAVQLHVMPARDHQGTLHGAILVVHDLSPEATLEERVHSLHTKATQDALTGIHNRAELDRRHAELVVSHSRSCEPLSLVITDIDRFKSINDTYGHQAGDEALIAFAQTIEAHSRDEDVVARYGGEEFVLLCPRCTTDDAVRRAEEIRRELAGTSQPALEQQIMTASFGVTELQPGDSPETMLQRADRALYQAKEQGRNRVVQLGREAEEIEEEPRSWFGWGRGNAECVLKRELHSSVPIKVIAEKLRGFVADHNAHVLSAEDGKLSLRLDERALPAQRRHNDRPVALTINLQFSEEPDGRTLIETEFTTRRGRNRRLSDASRQAERLLRSLQSYLIADEVFLDR